MKLHEQNEKDALFELYILNMTNNPELTQYIIEMHNAIYYNVPTIYDNNYTEIDIPEFPYEKHTTGYFVDNT